MNGDWSLLRLMINRVFGKTKEASETSDTSQSRFEAIEILEALILALVAVATAWSGFQAAPGLVNAQSSTPGRTGFESLRKALHPGRTGADLRQRYLQQLARREARWQGKSGGFFERRFLTRPYCLHSLVEHRSFQQRASATRPNLMPSITTQSTSSFSV